MRCAAAPGAVAEGRDEVRNVDPGILPRLGVHLDEAQISAAVRGVVGSEIVGCGLGRPTRVTSTSRSARATPAEWRCSIE